MHLQKHRCLSIKSIWEATPDQMKGALSWLLFISLSRFTIGYAQQPIVDSTLGHAIQGPVISVKSANVGPAYPPFLQLRYDEDYQYLRDTSKRTSQIDRLKYIPLGSRPASFLTLGGEVRYFFEQYTNETWGESVPGTNGYFLQRYMLHIDWHAGRRFRAFFQLKSGLEDGRTGGPRPPDEDRLDINQAFIDLNLVADNRPARSVKRWLIRVGRQELDFGAGRLISVRELPNVRQSFDGIRTTIIASAWHADAFWVRPAETKPGTFDDGTDQTQQIWSVYATRQIKSKMGLDVYYVGNWRDRAIFVQGIAAERRHSIGTRLVYRTGGLTSEAEATYQFGSFGAGRIRAWALSGHADYRISASPVALRVGLDGGINSGDKDRTNPDNNTFYPPAPRGAYFGAIGANGPSNIAGFAPSVTVNPVRSLTVKVYGYFFWRQRVQDGIYNIPGFPIKREEGSLAHYVGTQPEVDLMWQVNRYFSLTASYANFFSGAYLRQTPPSSTITYLAIWATFKF